jgi:hypothetical protein
MWAFKPINDICIDCDADIDPKAERNYIVWEPPSPKRGEHKGRYRRQCAICYDRAHQRPYERPSASTPIIHSTTPDLPTLG